MPAWLAPALIAAGQALIGWLGARKQARENKELAAFQNSANERLLREQLEYNTPRNQMLRYQDAGLNPHLIYGQGSPGNQNAPLSYPEVRPADYQRAMADILPLANQTSLIQSQVQAQNAKTRQVGVLAQLQQLQMRVLEKNPLLDNAGFKAIIDGLKSSAEIKAADSSIRSAQADWFAGEKSFNIDGVAMHGPAGALKMETELKLLLQKYELGAADARIKAEVVNSKQFQNDLLEIQKKWMTDGEITPQHIYQFIQLLLMKML